MRGPNERGWWYYYVYGLLVKMPVSALLLLGVSLAMVFWRRFRTTTVSELGLLLPAVAVITSLSFETGLNSHLRYVLPALPFLCVFAARPMLVCPRLLDWRALAITLLVLTGAVSVVRVHPHYLAYFNEVAGGPRAGVEHLADSNLDWGQGLIALREWHHEHQNGDRIYLAYSGAMDPENMGFVYEPLDPDDPQPGLHAISATLLAGLPTSVPTGNNCEVFWRPNAFAKYRDIEPIATPGYSIYVYEITPDDAQRMQRMRLTNPVNR